MFEFIHRRGKKHLRNDSSCRIFFMFLGLHSSVVRVFIGFLTSGLSFVKYFRGVIL